MKKSKIRLWFHGTKEEITGALRPMYLTSSKPLALLHGKVYSFHIPSTAKWLDLDEIQFFAPSMDSFGFNQSAIKKFRNKGYDIVWDSRDFSNGYDQIFILNPSILKMIEVKESFSSINVLLHYLFG